jgi:hypothetical protein
MHHPIEAVRVEEALERAHIGQIDLHELGVWMYGSVMPLEKVIEHHNAIAGLDEFLDNDAANIPGPAGNQNMHVYPLC